MKQETTLIKRMQKNLITEKGVFKINIIVSAPKQVMRIELVS